MFPQKYSIIIAIVLILLAIFNLHKKYKLVPRKVDPPKRKREKIPIEDEEESEVTVEKNTASS